ncbi:MAG: MotA/TolQ/ExbB proton channel family protein [Firmicutes bacterium]|nr:MotA/TolQ/ExbB proton channel family protein [Bacillota bacterium]
MNQASELSRILRSICASFEKPVIVILLIILACTLVLVGTLIAEIITERRHLRVWVPKLIDEIKKQDVPPALCIKRSGLLKRQKIALIEVTDHKDVTDAMRESLAIRLVDEAKGRYETIVKLSDLIIRIGPVFGLLGTLIPLGPGIIALGQGDTLTLSQSLLTAFDTTIVGLVCAAIATVISIVRKRWYSNDISVLETLMECVLEVEKKDA